MEPSAVGRTILDDYSIRLQLEHLWNADKCPALSRQQRVERIGEIGRMLAVGASHAQRGRAASEAEGRPAGGP